MALSIPGPSLALLFWTAHEAMDDIKLPGQGSVPRPTLINRKEHSPTSRPRKRDWCEFRSSKISGFHGRKRSEFPPGLSSHLFSNVPQSALSTINDRNLLLCLTSAVEVWKGDYGGYHASFIDNLTNERSFRDRNRRRGMITSWVYLWIGRVAEVQVVIRLVGTRKLLYNRAAAPRI